MAGESERDESRTTRARCSALAWRVEHTKRIWARTSTRCTGRRGGGGTTQRGQKRAQASIALGAAPPSQQAEKAQSPVGTTQPQHGKLVRPHAASMKGWAMVSTCGRSSGLRRRRSRQAGAARETRATDLKRLMITRGSLREAGRPSGSKMGPHKYREATYPAWEGRTILNT